MTPKYQNLAGVPLGGIGAGKIELCPDGAFRNLTIQNNLDMPLNDIHNPFKPMPTFPVVDMDACPELSPHGLESCFFGAFVEGVGATVLKEREPGLSTTLPRDSIGFVGEVPTADLQYPVMDGVELSLAAFSSLIFNEPEASQNRDSSVPGISLTFRAVNKSDHPRRVAFLFSFANLIGIGGFPNAAIKDFRDNFIEFLDTDGLRHLHFGHRIPKVDPRVEGTYTLACAAGPDIEVTHALYGIEQNHGGKKRLWDAFASCGRLGNDAEGGGFLAGALCAGRLLQPGESVEFPFVFAWYFPVRTDAKGRGLSYRNAYTRHFDSSFAAASYLVRNRDTLRARTDEWRGLLRRSNLPGWLTTKLINDTFPLYSNSLFDETGRFASSEAPCVMNGCMGTMDQRAASHALYAMGFPDLSRGELTLFSEQQISERHPERHATHWDMRTGKFDRPLDRFGAILHDVGWDDLDGGGLGSKGWLSPHWPDLSLVYVLQCHGHCIWSGDRSFLAYVYPKVKAALQFNRRLDQNGDGIAELWGPGCCTFDSGAFHYFGASSYIATLTLAALKAGAEMARWCGDESVAVELDTWFAKTRPIVEQKLFCAELGYFYSWVDDLHEASAGGERPHARESRNSMVAQLAGTFFARLLGLGEILDPVQVASALGKMVDKNIALCEFCPAQEVTDDNKTVSFSWPFYAEPYLIAQLFTIGRGDAGLAALLKLHTAMTINDGSPWSAPLVWKGPGNGEREWGAWYMTNTASWSVLPALCGFAFNAMDDRLRLAPEIPASLGKLSAVPLFFPRFHATVDADAAGDSLTIVKLIDCAELPVSTLEIHGPATITLNGTAVPAEVLPPVEGLARFRVNFRLKAGDHLRVSRGN